MYKSLLFRREIYRPSKSNVTDVINVVIMVFISIQTVHRLPPLIVLNRGLDRLSSKKTTALSHSKLVHSS